MKTGRLGGVSDRSWPSFRPVRPESLPRARSSPASRVHVPGSFTARSCPTVTGGLDGELARLQDQGTGGMALLQRRPPALDPAVPRLSRRSPRVRYEPGAAVARQGLKAAGPATGRVSGSAWCLASYGQSMRCVRDSALVARRSCMSGAQAARRALRALETALKVLTRGEPRRDMSRDSEPSRRAEKEADIGAGRHGTGTAPGGDTGLRPKGPPLVRSQTSELRR